MSSFWYSVASDFQNIVIGFLGFGGVAWTLRSNARLAREQHAETERLAEVQHAREIELRRRILRIGILFEIKAMESVQKFNVGKIDITPNDSRLFLKSFPTLSISRELIKEVGLLEYSEIWKVTECLFIVEDFRNLLSGFDVSGDGTMVEIKAENRESFGDLAIKALKSITSAKEEMEAALTRAAHSADA